MRGRRAAFARRAMGMMLADAHAATLVRDVDLKEVHAPRDTVTGKPR